MNHVNHSAELFLLIISAAVIGGILAVSLWTWLAPLFKSTKINKNFQWSEILTRRRFSLEEIQRMYLASVTFGECATGELLGSLDRLKSELSEDAYNVYEELHKDFGELVHALFLMRSNQEDPRFDTLRLETLAVYRRMEEFKAEHRLEFLDPFPAYVTPLAYHPV